MNENNIHSDNITKTKISPGRGWLAVSPIIVFLLLYVAVSVVLGDFYKMPVSVALCAASMWAVLIYRGKPLLKRIETFSQAAGHTNILYMIWVFILAGAFANIAKEIGAVDATVSLAMQVCPSGLVVPVLFLAACFISLSIGTSVGTVVALTPLAVEMADACGATVPFMVAVVLGGAFFGDNLSFISDTTIAATRSQYCDMSDKFKANMWIALPAALLTLSIYLIIGTVDAAHITVGVSHGASSWLLVIPYMIVLGTAIAGINVTVVLTLGILSAVLIGAFNGIGVLDMAGYAGAGIEGMGSLIVITLLAAGMLGIINAAGGIAFILQSLTGHVSGRRGAQAIIACLVAIVNLCTANNTVAIITVGDISNKISRQFGVDSRKTASLLDSTSCVIQALIPYGAQTLLATGMARISPVAPWPYLYYPWALAVMIVLSIVFLFPRRLNHRPQA